MKWANLSSRDLWKLTETWKKGILTLEVQPKTSLNIVIFLFDYLFFNCNVSTSDIDWFIRFLDYFHSYQISLKKHKIIPQFWIYKENCCSLKHNITNTYIIKQNINKQCKQRISNSNTLMRDIVRKRSNKSE